MFNVKPALIILAASLGFTAANSYAGSADALSACKQEISAQYSEDTHLKFNNNVATSTRGGKYTFWINSVAKQAGERNTLKAKCITTKQYEVLSLDIENGRWK